MKRVVFSPPVKSDIVIFGIIPKQRGAKKQAVTYTQNIRDACENLTTGLISGQPVDIRDGYLKLPCADHLIFYKTTQDVITVIRILHKRMDVGRYL